MKSVNGFELVGGNPIMIDVEYDKLSRNWVVIVLDNEGNWLREDGFMGATAYGGYHGNKDGAMMDAIEISKYHGGVPINIKQNGRVIKVITP